MKTITVSVDEGLYRQARIKAAEEGSSISALFKTFLLRLTSEAAAESEFQRLQREEEELRAELRSRSWDSTPRTT